MFFQDSRGVYVYVIDVIYFQLAHIIILKYKKITQKNLQFFQIF